MPRGDGTGPEGKGPKTGRGLGNCPDDNDDNKENNLRPRRGLGRRNRRFS